LEFHREGYQVVLDADIQGFFDNLSHRVIMTAVAAEVADGNILNLVERFLTAGVLEEKVFQPTVVGTPQGGVISPLLANIVLNHLDWKLEAAGYRLGFRRRQPDRTRCDLLPPDRFLLRHHCPAVMYCVQAFIWLRIGASDVPQSFAVSTMPSRWAETST